MRGAKPSRSLRISCADRGAFWSSACIIRSMFDDCGFWRHYDVYVRERKPEGSA